MIHSLICKINKAVYTVLLGIVALFATANMACAADVKPFLVVESGNQYHTLQEAVDAGVALSTVQGMWNAAVKAGWIVKEGA